MSLKNKLKTFFTLEDDFEYVEEDDQPEQTTSKQEPSAQSRQNVVSLTAMQTASSKVVLCEPKNFNESQEIADHIVNRRAVVINLQRVDRPQAKRIVDFLSGTVYAVSGDMQKLGSQTFLCTPDNVNVSGTISDLIEEEDL
ncbi:cell division protein SepF [Aquibacillus sediminis]|uniref:cell division protein SepF n=1 Tax=Aquibacillus sediminis TaxID=2574734 RepID=UPI00110956CD|nr:cell division protein SepF [Aquibacillus sediminis]